jgi:hypothetical protein
MHDQYSNSKTPTSSLVVFSSAIAFNRTTQYLGLLFLLCLFSPLYAQETSGSLAAISSGQSPSGQSPSGQSPSGQSQASEQAEELEWAKKLPIGSLMPAFTGRSTDDVLISSGTLTGEKGYLLFMNRSTVW